MKRSWSSILVVVLVVGLLTVFLGLQYRWLSAVSDAERERMHKRAETDTNRLAEDFDREMQAAYYNFQTGAQTWRTSDWTEFNERYDFWKSKTDYPELIRDVYFVSKQPGSELLRYDASARVFAPAPTTEEIEKLRAKFTVEKEFRPVYEDAFALVLPVHEEERRGEHIVLRRSPVPSRPVDVKMPESFGWMVILLDQSVIKERMLPALAAKYFPENDYRVAVVDRSGQPVFATHAVSATDASAKLFNMSPDNLLFFANREAIPRMMRDKQQGVVLNQRIESHTFSTSRETKSGETGTFKIEMKEAGANGRPRIATMTATTSGEEKPWTLQVQHSAGSIDAFVANERNKSFAIGLGIYLLLVGGILAIVWSALRSKRFAQRQIDFVSSVSHEFRTPLAVIYSAGENLADGVAKQDDQVAKYGELIKGEGKKLSGMVEQILEFAGANSGKRRYNFSTASIGEVVNDALDECKPLIESGGFTVETEIQDSLPTLQVDRLALASAIQNLIANSVKYSNGSKWIMVSAVNGGGSVKIAVEDRGLGIAPDELKKIFEPFYRTKEVVDRQISGNGLGLNLVQKIVEAHGGCVTAESRVGKGSKFTIELPV